MLLYFLFACVTGEEGVIGSAAGRALKNLRWLSQKTGVVTLLFNIDSILSFEDLDSFIPIGKSTEMIWIQCFSSIPNQLRYGGKFPPVITLYAISFLLDHESFIND